MKTILAEALAICFRINATDIVKRLDLVLECHAIWIYRIFRVTCVMCCGFLTHRHDLRENIGQTINSDAIPRFNKWDISLTDIPNDNHKPSLNKPLNKYHKVTQAAMKWYQRSTVSDCYVSFSYSHAVLHVIFMIWQGRLEYLYILTFSWMKHIVWHVWSASEMIPYVNQITMVHDLNNWSQYLYETLIHLYVYIYIYVCLK